METEIRKRGSNDINLVKHLPIIYLSIYLRVSDRAIFPSSFPISSPLLYFCPKTPGQEQKWKINKEKRGNIEMRNLRLRVNMMCLIRSGPLDRIPFAKRVLMKIK